jgi:hypothetical protein
MEDKPTIEELHKWMREREILLTFAPMLGLKETTIVVSSEPNEED